MSSGSESRTPYTQNEKLLLASLVDKHEIIENKRTDAHTNQEKQKEWEKIAAEFNAQATNTKRTSAQLRKLWNNLKQRKRKATTELKYQRLATGGGPESAVEDDPVMEAVNVAGPHVDVTLPCTWDSTGVYEARQAEETLTVSTEVNEDTQNESELFYPRISINVASPKTSTEINTSTQSLSETEKNGAVKLIKIESELRIQKMQDSIQQQNELHNIKMKIENEQLQTAIAVRRKAEAEAKVAELKLAIFKNQNKLE